MRIKVGRPVAVQHLALLSSYTLWRLASTTRHGGLFPLGQRDLVGFALAAGALLIAAGGGIGGGALLVPICLIVLGAHTIRSMRSTFR